MYRIIYQTLSITLLILTALYSSAQSDLEKSAYAAFQEKDYEQAVKLFQQILTTQPRNAIYYKDLGVCLSKLRDYPNAIYSLEKAASIDKTIADIYPPLALAYIKQGDIDKGIQAFETYSKSPDASPSILAFSYRSLGDIFISKNLQQKAASAYQKSAEAFYENKEYASSAEVYRTIIEFAPSATLYAELGKSYAKAFVPADAVLAFAKAVSLAPNNVEYQELLAQAYYVDRNFDKAAEQFSLLIENNPAKKGAYAAKMITSYREAGNGALQHKMFAEALEKYDLAQQYDPSNDGEYRDLNASVYIAMGDFNWGKGDYSEAESNYTSAVKLRSAPEQLHKKGAAHVKLEEWNRAILALEKSVDMQEDAVAYRDLGNAYYGKAFEDKDEKSNEYFEKAISAYSKAMELDIDFAEMYGWLGLAYVQLARIFDAEKAAEKAVENFVDEAMVAKLHFGIADLHRFNNGKKNAKPYFEKVVANPSALPSIVAYSYFYLGEKKKAYQLLQTNLSEAIDEQDAIASAYFSLAALYSKDKRIDDALVNMKFALENGFNDFKIIPSEMELVHLHDHPEFIAMKKEYNFKVRYIPKQIREQQFLQMDPIKVDGVGE